MKINKVNMNSINRGLQLRMVREYRGYTQSELCERIKGLSQANLSKFENGFDGTISEELLQKIMIFLNWPIGFLDAQNQRYNIEI